MNPQELTKKHLTEDQNHIIKVTLHKKETLYSILKWWKTLSKSDTIGDLDNVNGNTALIHIKLGSNTYYINAASNKNGVSIFLKNKANSWIFLRVNELYSIHANFQVHAQLPCFLHHCVELHLGFIGTQ